MSKAGGYQKRDRNGAGFGVEDRTSNYSADEQGESTNINMPHSIEAEQAVLGGLLLEHQRFDSVAEAMSASDFFRGGNQ